MKALVFDIETAPYPEKVLRGMIAAERHFDPTQASEKEIYAENKLSDEIVRMAALNSSTGMVCAIGFRWADPGEMVSAKAPDEIPGLEPKSEGVAAPASGSASQVLGEPGPPEFGVVGRNVNDVVFVTWRGHGTSEADILMQFWSLTADADRVVGYNSHGFDLPFLFQRSIMLGVPIALGLRDRQKWWSARSVDLMDWWTCGVRREEKRLRHGLDGVARSLGLDGKSGSGADFAPAWWSDLLVEQEKARAYLAHDIEMTHQAYVRMRACYEHGAPTQSYRWDGNSKYFRE